MAVSNSQPFPSRSVELDRLQNSMYGDDISLYGICSIGEVSGEASSDRNSSINHCPAHRHDAVITPSTVTVIIKLRAAGLSPQPVKGPWSRAAASARG